MSLAAPSSPEAARPEPAVRWYVPVRAGRSWSSLRLFRTPLGEPTAVAFTSPALLHDVLGPDQPWERLGERALRQLVGVLGITTVTVDPRLSAPAAGRPDPETETALAQAVRPTAAAVASGVGVRG